MKADVTIGMEDFQALVDDRKKLTAYLNGATLIRVWTLNPHGFYDGTTEMISKDETILKLNEAMNQLQEANRKLTREVVNLSTTKKPRWKIW